MKKILIVEDDPRFRRLLVAIITKKLGYAAEIIEVDTVGGACDAAGKCVPDVIITDYNLGDETSTEFIRDMKRIRPELPILLLTGSTHDISDAIELVGRENFITKPPATCITTAVRRLLKLR